MAGNQKTQNTELFASLPGKPIYYYSLIYLIVAVALFQSTLFDSSKLIFGTDLLEGNVFFRHFLVEYFRANFNWPVWDPYIHGGMPFVDGMHGDIFYIPSLICYIIFGVFHAWSILMALHVFLAGFFMFLLLRELKIRGMIAFVGGLMYMMAPSLISLAYAGHIGKMFIIAQTPLIFLIYLRADSRKKTIFYLLLAFMIFLGITTAHMQMAYYMFMTLGMYFIVRTIQKWRRDKFMPVKSMILFTAAVIIGLLMSAVQYVTPYKYLHEYSMRTLRTEGENKYEYATSWSMNFEEVTANFFPEFCGDNIQGQRTTYWGKNYFKLNSEHFGIIPLFLAIFGIGLWQRRDKWFFFWTAIIATIYALGANTPAFRLFYLLPGVKSFRAPGMINFIVNFSVIILGCGGLEALLSSKKSDKSFKKTWRIYTYITIGYTVFAMLIVILQMNFFKIWFAIFGAADTQKEQVLRTSLDVITLGAIISLIAVWGLFLLIKFYLSNKVKPQGIIYAITLFTIIYMWYFNSRFIIPYDYKADFVKTPAVKYIEDKRENDVFRTLILPRTMRDYLLPYHSLEVLSFTMLHGNQLATFEKLAGKRGGSSGLIYQPIQDLLNGKYFLSTQPLPPQYFNPERIKQIDRAGNTLIYENLTALPRAFPMYRYTIMENDDRIIATLSDTSFDYRTTVILEEMPADPPPAYDDSIKFEVLAAKVYDEHNDRFKVEVEMLEDGFLFLSENYYPAWKAYESGKLLTTLKADYTFRAIPLKKGKHTIECRYENETYNVALTVSKTTFILMLLVTIGLITKDKFFSRKKAEP